MDTKRSSHAALVHLLVFSYLHHLSSRRAVVMKLTADFSLGGRAVAQGASISPFLSIGRGLVAPALWTAEKQTGLNTAALAHQTAV